MKSSEESILIEKAFSKQAAVFDDEHRDNIIVKYKRERVRKHLNAQLKPGSFTLEINCGTGDDAVFLAKVGHTLHCTDLSQAMLNKLEDKIKNNGFNSSITTQCCSFTDLNRLQNEKKYDHVFSNFGGLNCTGELYKVLNSFGNLLNPGGRITLVIMPRFCLWENLLCLKGNFKTAFRRLKKNGAESNVEGVVFKSYYYSPHDVINQLKNKYTLEKLEGLCTLVPPSYLKNFPLRLPRFYNFLVRAENKLANKWPWKNCGDYFIISLRKNN